MPANDDIDDILRVAMKTLDDEIPSGYFEGLPKRTLARLEGSTMQTTSGTDGSNAELPNNELPMSNAADRDEDSGLHDIRNLAASSRARLSSRRLGTNPPPVEEDVLASTSGSWKSIALPEPARMVSLPEIAELPSKADIKAQQKAEKAAAKSRKSRPSGEMEMPLAAASSPAIAAQVSPSASSSLSGLEVASAKVIDAPPSLHIDNDVPSIGRAAIASGTAKGATTAAVGTAKGAATVTPMIGSRISGMQAGAQKKKGRGALIGLVGLGLAAAAGVVIYVATRPAADDKPQTAAAPPAPVATEPAKPAAVVTPIAKEEPKVEDTKVEVKEPDPVPVEPPVNAKTVKPAKPTVGRKPGKATIEVDDPGNGVKAPVKKDDTKKEPPKEGDPDFEQLLKDSGYQKKDADKPKLEKKSLSGGDFKNGMAAISKRAQGCYKGTQGTASVKLTIAPSGAVTKVSVSGVGAAEAGCVEAAVRGASFPAWEGGPQSFGYSYLLSE